MRAIIAILTLATLGHTNGGELTVGQQPTQQDKSVYAAKRNLENVLREMHNFKLSQTRPVTKEELRNLLDEIDVQRVNVNSCQQNCIAAAAVRFGITGSPLLG